MTDYPYNKQGWVPPKRLNVPDVAEQPILYISGPMSGNENFNYHSFENASKRLKQLGYAVISPAQPALLSSQYDWKYCMRNSIDLLLKANSIVLLPGWESSKGANLELQIAQSLGYQVWEYAKLVNEG